MTRQNINIGTNNNDGTGDKLRDAMRKVNDNFIELYELTPAATNLTITNSTISVDSSNGNLTLDPNGTGQLIVTSGAIINQARDSNGLFRVFDIGSTDVLTVNPQYKNVGVNTTANVQGLDVAGNLTITGNQSTINSNIVLGTANSFVQFTGKLSSSVIPLYDSLFDLGSSAVRFKDIFVDNVTSTNGFIDTVTTQNINTVNIDVDGDTFVGNLVFRNNEISNNVLNEDIEIKPYGTGNVFVNTRMIIGSGLTPMVNPYLQITGADNNFTQVGIQNTNTGKFACSDIVVFNDAGSDFFNFVDMGQNNTGWDGSLQYIYFLTSSNAIGWSVNDTLYQLDPSDGSSILAQGVIDEIATNPANASELRIRVCQVFTGTTGLFEQGSTAGLVYNTDTADSAMPQDHVVQTIIGTGNPTYNLGTDGSLNASTAKAIFGPNVIMAADTLVVTVNGNPKIAGVDYTVEFSKIRFYDVPTVGQTITIRQLPEANYPFTVGQSGDSYVYNNGSMLTIGTMTGHDVLFHVNGIRWNAEAGRIKAATRNWIFGTHNNNVNGPPDTGERVQVKGQLAVTQEIVQTSREIASSVGSPGDKAGMIASDDYYFYRCVANYDGSTAIWKRVALNSW